eukprot:8166583-Pyramimonas_sp.AAC.1
MVAHVRPRGAQSQSCHSLCESEGSSPMPSVLSAGFLTTTRIKVAALLGDLGESDPRLPTAGCARRCADGQAGSCGSRR